MNNTNDINNLFELTPQQKQLWVNNSLELENSPELDNSLELENSTKQELQVSWQLSSNIDKTQIEQAIQTLLSSHESLRLSYIEQAGLVYPLQAVVNQHQMQNQDIAFCAQLETDNKGHKLTLTLSALNADLYSIGLIHQHLSELLSSNNALLMEQPEVDYEQFSYWQSQCLNPQTAEQQEYQAALNLINNQPKSTTLLESISFHPTANNTVNHTTHKKPANLSITLDNSKQIHGLANKLNVSIESLLLSISYIAQFAQANQYNPLNQLAIDACLACRPFDELTTITGRLSKNSTVNIEHYRDDTLEKIISRVDNTLSQHQHLAEYLPGSDSRNAFLQSYLHTSQTPRVKLDSIIAVNPCAVAFTLIDFISENNEQENYIKAQIELQITDTNSNTDTDIKHAWQMWLERYKNILEQIIATPDVLLNNSIDELKTILAANNITQGSKTNDNSDYKNKPSIIAAIAHYAKHTPEQQAIVYEDQQLSYLELYQRINALGHKINQLTANKTTGSEHTVAINLPRGINYLVAMLACLATNNAFIPLDVTDNNNQGASTHNHSNSSRLQSLLDSIKPTLIIDNALLYQTAISSDSSAIEDTKTLPSGHQLQAQNLAYIIYTSGTTGEPKGVQISQGNLHNYAYSLCDHLKLSDGSKTPIKAACVSTLSADLGYSTLFSTWLIGGSVHLLPMNLAVDEARYREYLEDKQIDLVKMVPSHLQTLIDNNQKFSPTGHISELLPKQHLILGGETLSHKLLDKLLMATNKTNIHNHYGPSEATVGCFAINYSELNSEQLLTIKSFSNSAPIGKPLANVQFAIVDEKLRPVPQFAQGELIIGGAGISQGYRANGNQIKDQDRFIESGVLFDSKFSQHYRRAYRSGDKVVQLPSGELEFLGRLDSQVKLRGYRVELPAIEQQILKLNAVTSVCVKLHHPKSDPENNRQQQQRLVAWYSTDEEAPAKQITEQIIAHLKDTLPDYMCPTQWIALTQMPITSNGKINRKALPDPCQALAKQQMQTNMGQNPPQTATEKLLAKLWQELIGLGDSPISRNDDFFALGGNSLIATQVVANLRQQTGLNINLADLFDYPNLAKQSAYIDQKQSAYIDKLSQLEQSQQETAQQPSHNLPPKTIKKQALTGKHPLSFAQQRLWFLQQLNPNSSFYNVPAQIRFNNTAKKEVKLKDIERTLNTLSEYHHALRLRFCLNEHNQPQQYLSDLPITITQVNSHHADQTLINSLVTKKFDLLNEPPIRAHWITGQSHNTLLITLHHIISDAWSTDLLIKHFADAYHHRPLPKAQGKDKYNFIDHCHWQHHKQTQSIMTAQQSFWLQYLQGAEQYVQVPNDFERPEYQSYNGARLKALVNTGALAKLDDCAKQYQVSRFMLLATGFNLMLNHYSGQTDISIAIPVAGRNQTGFEHTVGLFLNTLVLRSELKNTFTPKALLEQIKGKSLKMFDNQDLPFDQLIRKLDIKRATSYTPFNQVCLNVLNTPLGKDLAIEEAQLIPASSHTAKYDFEWIISQSSSKLENAYLEILVEYNTDLFTPSTIQKMLDKYVQILTLLPTRINAPLNQLLSTNNDCLALTDAQHKLAKWRAKTVERAIQIDAKTPIDSNIKAPSITALNPATLIASCALALNAKEWAISNSSDQPEPFIINWQSTNILIDIAYAKTQGLNLSQWIDTITEQLALDALIPLTNHSQPHASLTIGSDNNSDLIFNNNTLTCEQNAYYPLLNLIDWVHQQINSDNGKPLVNEFAQLTWVTPHQEQQLINWGKGPQLIESDNLIGQINRQAKLTPTAIAITQNQGQGQQQQISYHELQQRSNQLANCLLENGINSGKIVALEANGIDWVMIMLAIIKTGAAYLPLDIELPIERKTKIINDAKVEIVLTSEHPWVTNAHQYIATNLNPTITADTPLYVLYTSGSTGEPKGALVTHKGEQNLVSWYQNEYQINTQDKLLIASSTSFDLTQKNIFTALCCGASLHFADMTKFDADCVIETLTTRKITLMNCAPSAFYSLLAVTKADELHKLSSLRCLLLGGEPIDLARLNPWLDLWLNQNGNQLVNMYGPTECTDIATAFSYDNSNLTTNTTPIKNQLPIGRASGGVQLYVLDKQQKMLPQGMIGELYIGGAGVGLGYLNRPEKTKACFIDNPLNPQQQNTKLYKSGDLVYIDHNQELVFVGRNDHQIKHRGFRVELGAISNAIQQHPQVITATCFISGQQLVACYQLNDESISAHELTEFVGKQLPHYMVPQQWQLMGNMPLSKNGKLDLIAIKNHYQQYNQNLHKQAQTTAKLTTERQIWLAELWQQLFKTNNIGHPSIQANSDFFGIGGHSLIATQLASRIRKETGLNLPLTALFEHSRLDDMAKVLDALSINATDKTVISQYQGEPSGPHPLSSAQQRLWFIQQLNPQDTSYNMSSYLMLNGNLNITALAQALQALVERHTSLRSIFIRTCVDKEQQSVYQKVSPVPQSILKCHYFDQSDTDKLMEIAAQKANTPFNLSKDLMLRANLFNDQLLQLTIHHIASDGWSMGIVIKELAALYQHYSVNLNQPHNLAPLPIQYSDYAHWQQQQLDDKRLNHLKRFWQQNLIGAPTLSKLPLDKPRPAIATSQGGRVDCHINQNQLEKLNQLATDAQATTFMAALAVFDLLMHQWTGQKDIVVGTDLANREQAELENLIGFFVNLLPTRVDLSDNPSFKQILNRTKAQCLDVYQHQDMPFDKLVELINPQRSQSYHPLVQVLFVMQNAPKTALAINDNGNNAEQQLTITPIEPKEHHTRFELGLFISPTPQGLSGHWSYNTQIFNQQTIVNLNQQFSQLMNQVCSAPDAPISQFKNTQKPNQAKRRRLSGLKSAAPKFAEIKGA